MALAHPIVGCLQPAVVQPDPGNPHVDHLDPVLPGLGIEPAQQGPGPAARAGPGNVAGAALRQFLVEQRRQQGLQLGIGLGGRAELAGQPDRIDDPIGHVGIDQQPLLVEAANPLGGVGIGHQSARQPDHLLQQRDLGDDPGAAILARTEPVDHAVGLAHPLDHRLLVFADNHEAGGRQQA